MLKKILKGIGGGGGDDGNYRVTDTDNLFAPKVNSECYFLNCQCKQDCYCDKDKNGNIRRLCLDINAYHHEINVYMTLLKKNANISTLISVENKKMKSNELIYFTKHYKSLRKLLSEINENKNSSSKFKITFSLIINELFAYINTFKKYNFIHGNLHIDNIFIEIVDNQLFFYVIDLCNSYFTDNDTENVDSNDYIIKYKIKYKTKYETKYKRTSFLNEYDAKRYVLNYWDFFSIYISLSLSNEKNSVIDLKYVKTVIENYIGEKMFDYMMKECQKYKDTENYNLIKIKYNSI